MNARASGSALVVGLLLLSLVSLLALAGAAAAQVELQLARNEQFRENAASAASAGIEIAIRHVTESASAIVPARLYGSLPDSGARYEVATRLLGQEIPAQLPGANLLSAHVEIVSVGHAARGARDQQRVIVTHTTAGTDPVARDCEPLAPGFKCASTGELRRLSWQRLPAP